MLHITKLRKLNFINHIIILLVLLACWNINNGWAEVIPTGTTINTGNTSSGKTIHKFGNNMIVGSDGTTYQLFGNVLKDSNGYTWHKFGNKIKRTDGKTCSFFGNSIKCAPPSP